MSREHAIALHKRMLELIRDAEPECEVQDAIDAALSTFLVCVHGADVSPDQVVRNVARAVGAQYGIPVEVVMGEPEPGEAS